MSQFFVIHPENPQARLIRQAVEILRAGGVVVYPTDSGYALGCRIGDKAAADRIRAIRRLDETHHFTLVCRDLSELATYAHAGNAVFRWLKQATPGPYTFILEATREVPRRLQHPKRRTIGLRVPDNAIVRDLLAELAEPLMSVTLILPGEEWPETDPYEIRQRLESVVDLVIDGGYCGTDPTSVIDLSGDEPVIMRRGKGSVELFENV